MDLGTLRQRITLDTPGIPVPNAAKGFTQPWIALSPPAVWASIEPATVRDLERVAAGTIIVSASHIVTVRDHPGITTQTRITWRDRWNKPHTANVVGLQHRDPLDDELVLLCQEIEPRPEPSTPTP